MYFFPRKWPSFIKTWNSKQSVFYGCSNWIIPNHYIKNGCFTQHPLKNGCLGYQGCVTSLREHGFEVHWSPKVVNSGPLMELNCFIFHGFFFSVKDRIDG